LHAILPSDSIILFPEGASNDGSPPPGPAVLPWYGDLNLACHVWQIARRLGARAAQLLHEAADPPTSLTTSADRCG